MGAKSLRSMRRSKRWQAVTIVEGIERKAEFDRGATEE